MDGDARAPCQKLIKQLAPLALLYCVVVVSVGYFTIHSEQERLHDRFVDRAKEIFREAEVNAKTFEICLDGFANHLRSQPTIDYDNAREFAARLISSYPALYMLELAEPVRHADKNTFEQQMRQRGLSGFSIHRFDYSGSRTVKAVANNDLYYPITLIEPMLPEVSPILGLDLLSLSRGDHPMVELSHTSTMPRASRLFHLAEGDLGYILHRPFRLASPLEKSPPQTYFALAALRAQDLLSEATRNMPGWAIQIQHASDSFNSLTNSPDLKSRGHFDVLSAGPPFPGSNGIGFQPLDLHYQLRSASQPLTLMVSYQPGIADLDLRQIGIITTLLIAVTGLFAVIIRNNCRRIAAETGYMEEILTQAHYDSLTGLPNINLLLDRLEQGIKLARRNREKIALCYLDLNKFKSINDRHGHDAGDALLKKVAARLREQLRDTDTVSRIHGDEFIIFLPQANTRQRAHHTVSKLKEAFEQPIHFQGMTHRIGISAGTVVFPDDGEDAESLINEADRRMYEDKQAR